MQNLYTIRDFKFRYPFGESSLSWPGEYKIEHGDIMLISGESGAGKSTLLYALKGFIPETIYGKMSGEVLYQGELLANLSNSEKAKIGFLFQNPSSQMIQRTVRQELAFGMENLGISSTKICKKVAKFSQEFQIAKLLDRDIFSLSGGEKQKIALLSVLLMDPEVLLFDEPTAFLDPDSAKHFVDLFHQVARDKTIITVEHNLEYLKDHLNRVLFVSKQGNITEHNLNKIEWRPQFSKISKHTSGDTILKIENLSFCYDKPLLNKLDLDIKQGEIVSIVGDNGAGKSTLLKLISGLIKKYEGKICYSGKDIRNIKYQNYYKDLSLLMQNPENHFIYDNVEKEVLGDDEILELSNLTGYNKRNPFTLSEGEKRRLSLAILWSLRSNLILLDEPTFGQDSANKANLIELISKMRQKGKSFLIVSHDLPFISAVSDKIFKLDKGVLNEQDLA